MWHYKKGDYNQLKREGRFLLACCESCRTEWVLTNYRYHVLKKDNRPQMEWLVLSPCHQTNTNTQPNCSFSLSQKCYPNQSIWNFLVSTGDPTRLMAPFHPPQIGYLSLKQSIFSPNPSILYSLPESSFLLARWKMLPKSRIVR